MRYLRAVKHAVLMTVLCMTTPVFLWASESSDVEHGPVLLVEMKGSRVNVYGERLISTPDHRVFFGAEEADYLFEPRLLDANDSRIQLMLPFQPISGRYKLKIGKTETEPSVDVVLVVDDSRIGIDDQTKGTADAILTVRDCEEDEAGCVSEVDADSSAFCGMSADFDPYQGSQAITVSKPKNSTSTTITPSRHVSFCAIMSEGGSLLTSILAPVEDGNTDSQ